MLQFVCDSCNAVKKPEEVWINGMAAENVGTQAARREVVIDASWRRDRAVQPFAVHFCSVECKDRYMEKLFQKPATLLQVEEVDVVPSAAARVIHARKTPVTATVTKKRTVSSRTARRR
jgi:hypothetical protein